MPFARKLRCVGGVLFNINLRSTHKSPTLDRTVKPCTAVLWSLRPSAALNSLFSSSVVGRDVSLCMVGVRIRHGEGSQGQTQPRDGRPGPWGQGLDPQGEGQPQAAGLELGPGLGDPQPTAAPRAGVAASQPSPCPPCCPGASPQDQQWEGAALSWP